MPKLPLELTEKVLESIRKGARTKDIVKLHGVSKSYVKLLKKSEASQAKPEIPIPPKPEPAPKTIPLEFLRPYWRALKSGNPTDRAYAEGAIEACLERGYCWPPNPPEIPPCPVRLKPEHVAEHEPAPPKPIRRCQNCQPRAEHI